MNPQSSMVPSSAVELVAASSMAPNAAAPLLGAPATLIRLTVDLVAGIILPTFTVSYLYSFNSAPTITLLYVQTGRTLATIATSMADMQTATGSVLL